MIVLAWNRWSSKLRRLRNRPVASAGRRRRARLLWSRASAASDDWKGDVPKARAELDRQRGRRALSPRCSSPQGRARGWRDSWFSRREREPWAPPAIVSRLSNSGHTPVVGVAAAFAKRSSAQARAGRGRAPRPSPTALPTALASEFEAGADVHHR